MEPSDRVREKWREHASMSSYNSIQLQIRRNTLSADELNKRIGEEDLLIGDSQHH